MKYLICQDWENTTNNHAGIKHMCVLLKTKYSDSYELVINSDKIGNPSKSIFKRLRWLFIVNIINPIVLIYTAFVLLFKLRKGDEVYLLEYMEVISPQYYLPKIIRKFKPYIKFAGLVHLTPQVLRTRYTKKKIKEWSILVDKIFTLGTSLTDFFLEEGIPKNKLITLFHYVDIDYYKPEKTASKSSQYKAVVIAMGNQKRNYTILHKIVENNPNVLFIICKGVSDIDSQFNSFKNVNLIGYVSEEKLKNLMNSADISLNVMDDTVGSNVIVTSLAMGLAIITSDVGSIRNYCTEENSIFCHNDDIFSFSNAIDFLASNSSSLKKIQEKALEKSRDLSIDNLHYNLCNIKL
jgi:glycosyltransferase involved in cell wall biosynthesis